MNDGILSQEEIDALLKGDDPGTGSAEAELLSPFEKDTLGEIGNISMGTAATTLSTLLRKKVSITTPTVELVDRKTFGDAYAMPYAVVEVKYRDGLAGSNVLVIKEHDAGVIADLMMGGDGQGEFTANEIMLSAIGEAMNQMVGSSTTSLSSMFNTRIDIEPPLVTMAELGQQILSIPSQFDDIVRIRFKMEIQDLLDSEMMQIIPIESVKDMIRMAMGGDEPEVDLASILEAEPAPAVESPYPIPPIVAEIPYPSAPPMAAAAPPPQPVYQAPQEMYSAPMASAPPPMQQPFAVQPVQFAPMHEHVVPSTPQNIGLIMDVPLDISVELGKTRKTIREILELQQGSIIQLDKLAGEPVDMLVNGRLIAKGEVVVIDENYGIRITTIISPIDRVNRLQ
ncbi:MAG TPA: flagellar motor switch phosphatase FliY [Syntrophomonadaceae bacterium]|nr:flagellar motor switch phosphatase FliY [Syntrophomonadaceae bacterium]